MAECSLAPKLAMPPGLEEFPVDLLPKLAAHHTTLKHRWSARVDSFPGTALQIAPKALKYIGAAYASQRQNENSAAHFT